LSLSVGQTKAVGILPAQLADEDIAGIELNLNDFPIPDHPLQATHAWDPGVELGHSSPLGQRKDGMSASALLSV
jgi:hypothetical protein